jgi:hypothetical protein
MGVEYSRALSVRRRAIFRLNVSPSTLEVPESALSAMAGGLVPSVTEGPLPNAINSWLYQLQGEASVDYQFRPNWRATGNYRHGVEYLAVFTQPVSTRGARVDLTGLITRRVDVSATAGHATGASALSPKTQNLDTSTGEVRIRYAFRRSFALYSEYQYYYYDLRGQARVAPGLPSVFEQHRVRAGFMLFAEPLRR